jgi:hypothetical protein
VRRRNRKSSPGSPLSASLFVKEPSLSAGRREVGCGDHPDYHSAVKAILVKRQQIIGRQISTTSTTTAGKASSSSAHARSRKPKAAASLQFVDGITPSPPKRMPVSASSDGATTTSCEGSQSTARATASASTSTTKPARFEDVGELTKAAAADDQVSSVQQIAIVRWESE